MVFYVTLEPSDEGGYTAYVPDLPGCISEGDSVGEALANIQEAIELYLDTDAETSPKFVSPVYSVGFKANSAMFVAEGSEDYAVGADIQRFAPADEQPLAREGVKVYKLIV